MAETLKFGNGTWATKEGSLLAYNSENGNFKPLPFTFDRSTSATRVNKQGLIEVVSNNEPRIDFKDNTKGALLLEPQRSNKIIYSEDFSELSTGGNMTIETGFLAPDGTLNARKITCTDNTGLISVGGTLANDARTIYAKTVSGTGTAQLLSHNTNTNNIFTITEQWQRFELNSTPSVASNFYVIDFRDPSQTLTEVILWGAQVEQGSYATSYIPTSGSAVTRVAESSSQTVPDGVIGQTEGTVFVDFKINNNPTSTRRVVIISDGTANKRIGISLGSNIIYAFIVDGGSTQCEIVKSSITSGNYKCAFAYNNNDFVFYVNGSQVGTDTSGTVPTCDRIDVGNQFGVSVLEGSINDIKLYNTRLSNAELQALTQ